MSLGCSYSKEKGLNSMKANTIVIIPAHNEAKSIFGVVSSIKRLYPDYAVAVINDGSSDDTANLAAKAGAAVLTHPFNMGYGVSLQTGYKYALLNGFEYLVQIDGDGQHEPKDIRVLLSKLKEKDCDIVLGSRFLGQATYKPSLCRAIGIKFFRSLLRLLSRRNISDPTTGFQAMNKKVLRLFVRDLFPYDYPDADIIILLSKLNFKIEEAPVSMYCNPQGKSMHKGIFNVAYYIFKMLLSMFIIKLRRYDF